MIVISAGQKKFLLNLARESITAELEKRPLSITKPEDELYDRKLGAFVTLHRFGNLRGCIGQVIPRMSLFETIVEMAKAAAFGDPRFPNLKQEEVDDIEIEISILSELILVKKADEIEVGRDGLMIRKGIYSGLLLPQVATEQNWDKHTFLDHTCLKAGLAPGSWQDPQTELYRFTADIFSEKEIKNN